MCVKKEDFKCFEDLYKTINDEGGIEQGEFISKSMIKKAYKAVKEE